MSTILGLDLGKFKSVARSYDTETTAVPLFAAVTEPSVSRAEAARAAPRNPVRSRTSCHGPWKVRS